MTILGDLQPTAIIDSGSRHMIIWRNDNQRGVLILSYMHDPVQPQRVYLYTVMWQSAESDMTDLSSTGFYTGEISGSAPVAKLRILEMLNWMMRK